MFFIFQSIIPLKWRPWSDDLAGIELYEYELYEIQYDGGSLTEQKILFTSDKIPHNQSQVNLNKSQLRNGFVDM